MPKIPPCYIFFSSTTEDVVKSTTTFLTEYHTASEIWQSWVFLRHSHCKTKNIYESVHHRKHCLQIPYLHQPFIIWVNSLSTNKQYCHFCSFSWLWSFGHNQSCSGATPNSRSRRAVRDVKPPTCNACTQPIELPSPVPRTFLKSGSKLFDTPHFPLCAKQDTHIRHSLTNSWFSSPLHQ